MYIIVIMFLNCKRSYLCHSFIVIVVVVVVVGMYADLCSGALSLFYAPLPNHQP